MGESLLVARAALRTAIRVTELRPRGGFRFRTGHIDPTLASLDARLMTRESGPEIVTGWAHWEARLCQCIESVLRASSVCFSCRLRCTYTRPPHPQKPGTS